MSCVRSTIARTLRSSRTSLSLSIRARSPPISNSFLCHLQVILHLRWIKMASRSARTRLTLKTTAHPSTWSRRSKVRRTSNFKFFMIAGARARQFPPALTPSYLVKRSAKVQPFSTWLAASRLRSPTGTRGSNWISMTPHRRQVLLPSGWTNVPTGSLSGASRRRGVTSTPGTDRRTRADQTYLPSTTLSVAAQWTS